MVNKNSNDVQTRFVDPYGKDVQNTYNDDENSKNMGLLNSNLSKSNFGKISPIAEQLQSPQKSLNA